MKEVIEGFAARNYSGLIYLFETCPIRCTDPRYKVWINTCSIGIKLPTQSFSDITWKDEPTKVKVTIEMED